jgi:hypothetical protein
VVDPFVGSGNTLYWLQRHLPGARAMGFESDHGVFRLTQPNLELLALPVEIFNTDYRSGLAAVSAAAGELLVAFVAPPWGDALSPSHGLDLRRTSPPISGIVDSLARDFAHTRLLCVIQVHETVEAESLAQLRACFDWSALQVYGLNAPGQNHGILLGSKAWRP